MNPSVRTKLQKVVNYINKEGVTICNENDDGRVNSIEDENVLIKRLAEACKALGFSFYEPPPRSWNDWKFEGEPVQIKSSAGSADNWSSARALLYAVSDSTFEDVDNFQNRGPRIWEKLRDLPDENKTNKGMPILVVDKHTGKVHLKCLTELGGLQSNGSNLPFQIKWKEELKSEPVLRDAQAAYKFIMSAYYESIKKRNRQYIEEGFAV